MPETGRRQVLDDFDSRTEAGVMASGADGRVLIVRPVRIELAAAPADERGRITG